MQAICLRLQCVCAAAATEALLGLAAATRRARRRFYLLSPLLKEQMSSIILPLALSLPVLSAAATFFFLHQSRVRLATSLPTSAIVGASAAALEFAQRDVDAAALRAAYLARRDAHQWGWRGGGGGFGGSEDAAAADAPASDEAAAISAHLKAITRNDLPRVVPREAREQARELTAHDDAATEAAKV